MMFRTVDYNAEKNALRIIDQTLLPNEERFLDLTTAEEIREAICTLRVRGAPAIGVASAIGIAVVMKNYLTADYLDFAEEFSKIFKCFYSARPTAVNLGWALERMKNVLINSIGISIKELKEKLISEALDIANDDIECCKKIGKNGLKLLKNGSRILTHCNAGSLAAVQYGTALSPIYLATEKGMEIKVYTDETRPLLQGARLTAWELKNAGIDVTVICDNMVSSLMQKGETDAVFVGADRIAANGDAANKIGTSGVAVLANYYDIPFYVFAPSSTLDKNCPDGLSIKIEERDGAEISSLWYENRMTPEGISCYNPAFDITPNELITAIITENGIYQRSEFYCLK